MMMIMMVVKVINLIYVTTCYATHLLVSIVQETTAKFVKKRLFINDEKFIDAQCAITCDNVNKSNDVSYDNQSDGGNAMLSSDNNTALYDAECLENDGEREDDNSSGVKQSTDELSKNNNSSIYTILSETDDKEEN